MEIIENHIWLLSIVKQNFKRDFLKRDWNWKNSPSNHFLRLKIGWELQNIINLNIFIFTCFLCIFRPQTDIFALLQTKKHKELRESKKIQNSPLAFVENVTFQVLAKF